MLVTRVLGDCPRCKAKASYGNVDIYRDHVLRGCKNCSYEARYYLPPVRKAVLYLDQFFYSGAFRGGDQRFVDAAKRVRELAGKQLLVSPYSSVHSDETHLWEQREQLFEFIKAASRGHQFKPAYDIEREQVLNAFEAGSQASHRPIKLGTAKRWNGMSISGTAISGSTLTGIAATSS